MKCDRIFRFDDNISLGHNWPGLPCRVLMPGVGFWPPIATLTGFKEQNRFFSRNRYIASEI